MLCAYTLKSSLYDSNTTLVKVKYCVDNMSWYFIPNSNTTLVKVKFGQISQNYGTSTNSNTTLVKVKCVVSFFEYSWSDSNTTLVKVKLSDVDKLRYCIDIQIQHLLKLNQKYVICSVVDRMNSNTTLVKVKSSQSAQTATTKAKFKYNTC